MKVIALAAALVAASLLSPSKGRAQPAGAGGDYYGGGPLAPTPLVPQSTLDAAARAAEAQRRADELPRWQDYPRPAFHYPPPESETQRRIRELQEQNQLLGQEWTQQILRDALRR